MSITSYILPLIHMHQMVITISVLMKFSLKWKLKILNPFYCDNYNLGVKNNLMFSKEKLINVCKLSLITFVMLDATFFGEQLFQGYNELVLMHNEILELDYENLKKYEKEQIEIFNNICFEQLKKECVKIRL